MFILMLILFFILFLCSYYLFKKDLFAPGIIVSFVYLVSGLCALYNYTKWNLGAYQHQTVIIIISGLLCFLITSLIVWIKKGEIDLKAAKDCVIFDIKESWRKIKNIKKHKISWKEFATWKNISTKKKKIKSLIFSKKICFIFIAIISITILYKIWEILQVNELYGHQTSIFKMIGYYRSAVSYSSKNIAYEAPFLLKQLEKVITVIAYVCSYILINNMINKKTFKNSIGYLFYIILFCLYAIISGGRMPMIKLLAACIFYYYIFQNIKYGWNKKELRKKTISILAGVFIVVATIFPLLHNVLGRNRSFTADYYITMYAGGSMKLMDMYVAKPITSDSFGKETFYGLNQILSKLKIIQGKTYIKHLEFRTYNKLFLGNVYTPFRRYYADFGLAGVMILSAIFAVVINFFYLFVKKKILENKNYVNWVISYGFVVYMLFLYSIDDQFYTVGISASYAAHFAILWLILILYNRFSNKHDKYRRKDKKQ